MTDGYSQDAAITHEYKSKYGTSTDSTVITVTCDNAAAAAGADADADADANANAKGRECADAFTQCVAINYSTVLNCTTELYY